MDYRAEVRRLSPNVRPMLNDAIPPQNGSE